MLPPLESESDLIDQMTTPSPAVRRAVSDVDGDIMILGVGGKMGPTLAELLVRAGAKRVIGVSRFSDESQQTYLEKAGVETIKADLLNEEDLKSLPQASNIMLLAGYKFGASGNQPMTWAMNAWVPGMVMGRFPGSKVIYVSSGNVYAFTETDSAGSSEISETAPVGEYAGSRLGGERISEYLSVKNRTPLTIVRLFYATELRYGIIHDIIQKVQRGRTIDLTMGHVNQIWQGDANGYLARMFPMCDYPAKVVNLTGPEVLTVRRIAEQAGEILGKTPVFSGKESETALLGDTKELYQHFESPAISSDQMIDWVAHWVAIDGRSIGKPTKYESRTGSF